MGGNALSSIPPDHDGTVHILSWKQLGAITHVGITIHGILFEYSNVGLEEFTGKRCTFEAKNLGVSRKSEREVDRWISIQKANDFKKEKFDIVEHNCIVFAKRMTDFLEVSFCPSAAEQAKWCKENPTMTRVGQFFGASNRSQR